MNFLYPTVIDIRKTFHSVKSIFDKLTVVATNSLLTKMIFYKTCPRTTSKTDLSSFQLDLLEIEEMPFVIVSKKLFVDIPRF